MEATLRYALRPDLENKKGEQPVNLLIHLSSQRKKLSTGINLIPELWSLENQQIINLTSKLKTQLEKKYGGNLPSKHFLFQYQDELIDLKNLIRKIEENFRSEGISYSIEMLIEKIRESRQKKIKKEDSSNLIYDFIDQYISDNELTRARGGLMVYRSLKKYLQGYETKMRTRLTFDKIDYSFMQSFQNFLINWEEVNQKTKRVKTINNITIAKQLGTLKTIMGYAKRNGIEVNNGV